MNLIGAFELGTGLFYGVSTAFKVNAGRFRRFLCHLKHELRTDNILVICDNASFHNAKWLQEWVGHNHAWLRVEFLPAYSPDFNPIERLWRWMKKDELEHFDFDARLDLIKMLNVTATFAVEEGQKVVYVHFGLNSDRFCIDSNAS